MLGRVKFESKLVKLVQPTAEIGILDVFASLDSAHEDTKLFHLETRG